MLLFIENERYHREMFHIFVRTFMLVILYCAMCGSPKLQFPFLKGPFLKISEWCYSHDNESSHAAVSEQRRQQYSRNISLFSLISIVIYQETPLYVGDDTDREIHGDSGSIQNITNKHGNLLSFDRGDRYNLITDIDFISRFQCKCYIGCYLIRFG